MVSLNILAAGLELFVGLFIGFYFTDKKQGLSFNDAKIASIMFLTLHAILLFMDKLNWVSLAYMVASFVALLSGIFLGEYIRIRVAQKLVNKAVRKEDVYQTIKVFIERTERVAIYAEDADGLHEHLVSVQEQIDQARLRIKVMKQPEMFAHLNHISDTCARMANMSTQVRGTEDIEKYRRLGQSLVELSWDTLSAMEDGVTKRVSKPIGAMSTAIKINSMK